MEISAGARAAAVAPQVEPSPDPFSAANADSELDTYHKDWMEIDWIEIDDFIINLAGKGQTQRPWTARRHERGLDSPGAGACTTAIVPATASTGIMTIDPEEAVENWSTFLADNPTLVPPESDTSLTAEADSNGWTSGRAAGLGQESLRLEDSDLGVQVSDTAASWSDSEGFPNGTPLPAGESQILLPAVARASLPVRGSGLAENHLSGSAVSGLLVCSSRTANVGGRHNLNTDIFCSHEQ